MKAVHTLVDAAYIKPDICLAAQRLTVFPCTILDLLFFWGVWFAHRRSFVLLDDDPDQRLVKDMCCSMHSALSTSSFL